VFGGRTQGNCGVYPGQSFVNTKTGGGVIALGQVILPGGINYSAWVDKAW